MRYTVNLTKAVGAGATDGPDKLTTPTGYTRVYREIRFNAVSGIRLLVNYQQIEVVNCDTNLNVHAAVALPMEIEAASGQELTVRWINSTGGSITAVAVLSYDEVPA